MLPNAAEKITVVDSLLTTMALGWPILTAARAAYAGESLSVCQKVAENACAHSGVLLVVETLEFMRRGGRIGGAQAFLGTALNIKPVLEMRDGKIEPVEKVRTRQKVIQCAVDVVAERIKGKTPIRLAVTHANDEVEAASMLKAASTKLDPVETICCPLSPVIGTHRSRNACAELHERHRLASEFPAICPKLKKIAPSKIHLVSSRGFFRRARSKQKNDETSFQKLPDVF